MRATIVLGALLVGSCVPACSSSDRGVPKLEASDIQKCVIRYRSRVAELPAKEASELWVLVEGVLSRKDLEPFAGWPKEMDRRPTPDTRLQFHTDAHSRDPDCDFGIWRFAPKHLVGFWPDKMYVVEKEVLAEIFAMLDTGIAAYERKGRE